MLLCQSKAGLGLDRGSFAHRALTGAEFALRAAPRLAEAVCPTYQGTFLARKATKCPYPPHLPCWL